VFYLPDTANAAIPADIREQFQTDAHGRILFFTAPPIPDADEADEKKKLAHTPKYLAWKARQMREKLLKRKLNEDEPASAGAEKNVKAESPNGVDAGEHPSSLQKKQRMNLDIADDINGDVSPKELLERFSDQMCDLAMESWKSLYPDDEDDGVWKEEMLENIRQLSVAWEKNAQSEEILASEKEKERESQRGKIVGLTNLMDYKPPNERMEWGRRG